MSAGQGEFSFDDDPADEGAAGPSRVDAPPPSGPDASDGSAGATELRAVRVLPDVPAIGREFDYSVPPAMAEGVRVGSMVRVELHGRRVGAWVTADDVGASSGLVLRPLAKVTGWGPPPEILDLASWAAWRWAGRTASLLRTASPATAVRGLPRRPGQRPPAPMPVAPDELHRLAVEALAEPVSVLRLAPTVDPYPVLVAAAGLGPILVAAPVAATARRLGLRLRRAGLPVALLPDDWSLARAGWASAVGARAAAWAPVAAPAAIVVLDEHDESFQQEQAPTWHARDVLLERARRAGVPFVLVSPVPSLEALDAGRLLTQSRAAERAGWPMVDVVDRRGEPPGSGLFSPRLVDVLRSDSRVVCILNRKGRSRLLACDGCGTVATCERCDAAVVQGEDGALTCQRCATSRPPICLRCGATRMRNLRAGVNRVREELEALVREPVAELTADAPGGVRGGGTRVVVGTEAALHQVDTADVVAFLDIDQELLAPRYRAAEESLALLARAARLVGGRSTGGRLLVQTRQPQHEVLQAAVLADPARVSDVERARREALGYPPSRALALVSGAAAAAWVDAFVAPIGVEVLGPADGRWIVRAADHATLCDALAAAVRPPGRLRIEVDPLRL